MKHVLFFIAEKDFRDEEYFEPKQVLEDEGIICEAVSTNPVQAEGKLGAVVMPTVNLDKVVIDEYDAIVLVGGPGAPEMGKDQKVQQRIIEAYQKNKIIAAICIAPTVLAEMNMLNGKCATVFPSGTETLKQFDAVYKDEPVVVDKSDPKHIFITAKGPEAAVQFGKTICTELSSD